MPRNVKQNTGGTRKSATKHKLIEEFEEMGNVPKPGTSCEEQPSLGDTGTKRGRKKVHNKVKNLPVVMTRSRTGGIVGNMDNSVVDSKANRGKQNISITTKVNSKSEGSSEGSITNNNMVISTAEQDLARITRVPGDKYFGDRFFEGTLPQYRILNLFSRKRGGSVEPVQELQGDHIEVDTFEQGEFLSEEDEQNGQEQDQDEQSGVSS